MTYDVIVIGAGVNGLAAAAYLARAGRKVLVLERCERIGGMAATEEFHPGFRANACRDDPGWIPERMLRDLRLVRHGLRIERAPVGLVAARRDAPPIALWPDVAKTAAALEGHSPDDARRWPAFCALVSQVSKILATLYRSPPPRPQGRAVADLMSLLSLGRKLRRLGRREMLDVLRVLPMPVADLVEEWVSEPALAGALATEGIRHVMHGPLSSGTAFVFFHGLASAPAGSIGVRRVVRGGTITLAEALSTAATALGAEVRVNADVVQVIVRDNAVTGVVTARGEEHAAPLVVSGADPQRTFALVDPTWLDVELTGAVDHVRMRGSTARVHLALDGLPAFGSGRGVWPDELLRGTIALVPSVAAVELAYDEAKYGDLPANPGLTVTIPSLADASLAPAGRHVVSVDVHHVAFSRRGGWGTAQRDALGELVETRLAEHAPGVRDRVLHRWVLTPADLAERYGLTGGSLTHGELALDQILFMRPVPACARYATPLRGLWLCGIGTHPASAAGACGMLAAREILRSEV